MIDLVAGILAGAGVSSPPVRLPAVTDSLGIRVREFRRFLPGEDSLLVRSDRSMVCYFNPHTSGTRRRFSIAHEVAHAVLHRGRGFHLGDTKESETSLEREADAFAAELLMPTAWMLDACLKGPSFDDLRDLFWVSRQAMRRRLSDLGLLVPRRSFPSFHEWAVMDRDEALALYARFDPFAPSVLYSSVTGDPYQDYLLMRGVLGGVRTPMDGWTPRGADVATSPLVLIQP